MMLGNEPAASSPSDTFERATHGEARPLLHRDKLEKAFGEDLSEVEFYPGRSELGEVAARGAAKGNKIATQNANPDQALLAHEITHVLQQRQHGISAEAASRDVSEPGDVAEREADAVAASFAELGSDGPMLSVRAAPTARLHLDRGGKDLRSDHGGKPKTDAVESLHVIVPRESLIVPAFMTERQVSISGIARTPLPADGVVHTVMWTLSSPPPLRAQEGNVSWQPGSTSPSPFSVLLGVGQHQLQVSIHDPNEQLRVITQTINVMAAPDATGASRRRSAAVLGSTLSSSDLQTSMASLRAEMTKPAPEAYDPGAGARKTARQDLAGLGYAASLRGERPKPPPAGDETMTFEGRTLSTSPVYARYVLEELMAGGTAQASAFINRFETQFVTNRAANLASATKFLQASDNEPGGVDGGVPLGPKGFANLSADNKRPCTILTN